MLGTSSESKIKSRSTSCNVAKRNQVECDCKPANINHGFNNIFVHPPDPMLKQSSAVDPSAYHRRKTYFWVPELFYYYLVRHIPCPDCGDVAGNVISRGWNSSGPKTVASLGEEYNIVCKVYHCNICKRRFLGYDDDVIKRLPEAVKVQFPCRIKKKTSTDNTLTDMILFLATNGLSFQKISKMYRSVNNNHYWKVVLAYLNLSIKSCKNPFGTVKKVKVLSKQNSL